LHGASLTALITGSVQVKGLAELERALVDLGGVLGQKTLRSSMLAAMRPLVEAARANALAIAKSGSLALAMGARFAIEQRAVSTFGFKLTDVLSAAVVSAGPLYSDRPARAAYALYYRRGAGKRGVAAGIFHGHLIEFGTRHSAAQPFLRPAFDATNGEVIDRFVEELRTRIEKIRSAGTL
jgi:HK97 gp10 family phage protein